MSDSPRSRATGLVLLSICFLGQIGCGKQHQESTPVDNRPHVTLTTARTASVMPTRRIAGIIAPYQNIVLSSTLAEPADSVDVVEGDHVHQGQRIAQLDTSDLEANLLAARQNATAAQASEQRQRFNSLQSIGQGVGGSGEANAALHQAQERLRLDRLTLQRDESLLAQSYIPQQTVDTQRESVASDIAAVASAQATLRAAQIVVDTNGSVSSGLQGASIANAEAATEAARAQAQQILASIAHARIVSPIDGIVINRNLNPGEYPNGRTLFILQELDRVYAVLNASPAQAMDLRRDLVVDVTPNDGHSQTWHGRLDAILGETTPGSSNFTLKVLIQTPDESLLAGTPITATIHLPRTVGVRIPRGAFTDATESTVILVTQGRAHPRTVNVVAEDGQNAVVTGIHAGDAVVASGDASLIENEAVAVH